ncbi:TPA: hypothetical protein ACPZLH_001543 [Yersinia enterocolitica]
MMDTTTSRAEFEKWLEEIHGLYGEDIDWEPERNCYRIFGVHLAWCAWQASRASIAVTLPKTCRDIAGEDAHLDSDETSFDSGIILCAEALRSAGLTVKGD